MITMIMMNNLLCLDDAFHYRRCHAEEVKGFYYQYLGSNDRSAPTLSAIFDISIKHNCQTTVFPLSDVNKIKHIKSFQEAWR